MDQPVRDSKVDLLSTRNLDFHQRQIKNAAPAVDDDDYVILKQIKDLIANVTANAQGSNQPVITTVGGGGSTASAVGRSGAIQFSDGKKNFAADDHFTYDTSSGVLAIQEDINSFPNSGIIAPIFNATGDKDGYIFQAYSPNKPPDFQYPIMMNMDGDISSLGRVIAYGFIFDGLTVDPVTSTGRAVLYYNTISNQILVSYDNAQYVPFGGVAIGIKGAIQLSDGNSKFTADNHFTYDTTSGVMAIQEDINLFPNSGVIAPIFNATGDKDGYIFQAYSPGMPENFRFPIMMNTIGDISAIGRIIGGGFIFDGTTTPVQTSATRAVLYYDTTQNQILVSYDQAAYVPFGGGNAAGTLGAVQFSDGNKKFVADNTFTYDPTSGVLALQSTKPDSGVIAKIFNATGDIDGYVFQAYIPGMPSDFQYPIMMDIHGNIAALGLIASNSFVYDGNTADPAKSAGRAVVYYNTTQNQLLVSYNNAPYVPFGGSGGGVSVGVKYAVQVSDGNKLFLASNTVTLDTTKNVLTLTNTDVTSGITAPIFSATGRTGDGYAFQAPLTAIDINGNVSTSNVITKDVYIQQLAVVPTAKSGYNVFYADTSVPSQILTPAVLASPTFNSYAPNNSSTVTAVQQKDGTFKIFGDGHAEFQYLKLTTPTTGQVPFMDGTTLSGSNALTWVKPPTVGTTVAGLKITSLDSSSQVVMIINTNLPIVGRRVDFATNSVARWSLRCDGSTESGGNAGSNFDIERFDDSGNYLSSPISINRATGLVTIPSLSATISVPGANTQVMFNSNGALAGNANFIYDYNNNRLTIANVIPPGGSAPGMVSPLFNSTATSGNAFACAGGVYGINYLGDGGFRGLQVNGIYYAWPTTAPTANQVLTAVGDSVYTLKWAASSGSGSQTPWLSNIDGFMYSLSRVGSLGIGGYGPNSGVALSVVVPNPTTAATATQFRIGEQTANPLYGLNIGFYIDSVAGTYKSVIQGTTGAPIGALLLNPLGGSVGIGTTSPTGSLQITTQNVSGVNGTAPLVLDRVYGDVGDYQDIVFSGGSGNIPNRGGIIRSIANGGGETGLAFYTQTAGGDAANHQSVIILGNGNVGIGNSTPSVKLDIISNDNSDTGGALRIIPANQSQTATYSWGGITGSLYLKVQSGTTSYISLNAGGGKVGIGNNAPGYILDVTGTINSSTWVQAPYFNAFSANNSTSVGFQTSIGSFVVYGDGHVTCTSIYSNQFRVCDPNDTGHILDHSWVIDNVNTSGLLRFSNWASAVIMSLATVGGLATFYFPVQMNSNLTVAGTLTVSGGMSITGTFTASGGFIGPVFNAANAPNDTTAAFQCPGARIQGNGDSSFGATNFKSITTSPGGTISCAGILYANGSMSLSGTMTGVATIDIDQWIRTKQYYMIVSGGTSYTGYTGPVAGRSCIGGIVV